MQLIGLLGGMSWQSTALYYRLINEAVETRLGELHSARILLHSVDFHEIERRQHAGDWMGTADILGAAAAGLKQAGADFLVIATNTMHKVADEIASASGLDILHIADPTGEALIKAGVNRVGLLGTRFTMEEDFYRERLQKVHGLDVLLPTAEQRTLVHDVIYGELCRGVIEPRSAEAYRSVIAGLHDRGAEAVILGCTEITLLIGPHNSPLPVFDTTALHAEAAVRRAVGTERKDGAE